MGSEKVKPPSYHQSCFIIDWSENALFQYYIGDKENLSLCLWIFWISSSEFHMNKSSVLISNFWNLKLNLVGVNFTWTNPVLITPLNLIATYCLSVICLSRKHCHFNILSTTVCNYNQCMVLHLFAAQRPAEKRSWTVVQAFKKGALPSSTLY